MWNLLQRFDRLIDRLFVVLRRQILRYTHRIVNRRDLSDTNDVEIFIGERRQKVLTRRRHGVVVPVLRAIKRSGLAQERPRDHATHFVFAIKYATRDLADLVKPFERDHFLVRGYLKN